MLFNSKHFEQFFNEKNLKRGLNFFLKGEVEPLLLHSSRELFFVVSGKELSIKMKGDKVIYYSCSCRTHNFCSHLSAAFFYLQKDTFDVKLKDKTQVNVHKAEIVFKKESQVLVKRKKSEIEKLEDFIQKQKRQVLASELLPLLSENTLLNISDLYRLLLNHLIEPILSKPSLGTREVEYLEKRLREFIDHSESVKSKDTYYLFLSISEIYLHLFNQRYSGDEEKLLALYKEVCAELENYFSKGLTDLQEVAWYKTLIHSVENNKNLSTGVFEFLLPHWVSNTKDKQKLWHLGQLLSKRHLKSSYSERLDKLIISRSMVYLRESKLFKTPLPLITKEDAVELIIAKAELDFYSGRNDKAFKILETHYDEIKNNNASFYKEYLDYLLYRANKEKRLDLEIKYLRESFVNGLFILNDKLNYFLSLMPQHQRTQEVTDLLKLIKRNPFNYSFDKVATLLWEDKRWDELIGEIKKQKNKFQLLHDAVLMKLPNYNESDLNLYAKHLISSILEMEFFPYQIELLNKSKIYLRQLPEHESLPFFKVVINGLLKQSQIYRHLKEEFDLDL